MVNKLTIGVIGIQGAISEHLKTMKHALKVTNISGKVFVIKDKNDLKKIDAMILPGGESTTISRVLYRSDLYDIILNRIHDDNLPIMGTCAGCVILASEVSNDEKEVNLLSVMDMKVQRNAFGRQKESFEYNIEIKGFSKPYTAVFIRAPAIEKVWNNCEILASFNKKIVMAKQNSFLALSFHPELTNDFRIHRLFLDMVY
jgi:5'-phosphate synthase pdxT subunit